MTHEIARKEDLSSENYLLEVRAPLVAEYDKIILVTEKSRKTSHELDTYKWVMPRSCD